MSDQGKKKDPSIIEVSASNKLRMITVTEGTVRKGGQNPAPSTKRPSNPPTGQGGKGANGESK